MRTKFFAIALSAALIANPIAGFAQQIDLSDPAVKSQLPEDLMKSLMETARKKTLDDLRSTAARVDTMIAQIDGMQVKAEDDLFLQYAKRFQGALVLLNAWAVKTHMKDKGASDVMAYLSVASAAVNIMIRHWNPMTHSFDLEANGGRIDAKAVTKLIDQSMQEIQNQPGMPKEVTEAVASLQKLKGSVDQQNNKFVEMVEEFGGTQDVVAGLSGLSILIKLVSPKLSKITDKIIGKTVPLAQRAKQSGSVTALAADAPEVIGLAFGMGSEEAQVMLLKTLEHLRSTKGNLETEIRCQSLGPVTPEQRKSLGC